MKKKDRIVVVCNETQKKIIEDKAQKDGRSVSNYVLKKAMD